jgi:phosphotransferase system  glucose/maltose/N-acetylglucosamine-specific IIC component
VETTCNIEVNQLSFLGPGVPLFFLFLKYIVLLLLLMSVLFMGFAIISNATSNDCGTISSCIPDAFNTISLINKKSNRNFLEIQSYLGLAFVLICIFFFHFFRFQARKLQRECDEVINSPSDYAIILRRLPADITEEDIEEVIKLRRASLTVE